MRHSAGNYKELAMSSVATDDTNKKDEFDFVATGNGESKGVPAPASTLKYKVKDVPPIPVTLMSALQHILLSISGCLTTSAVVADVACVPDDHPVRSQLFCTTLFMVGVCTLMQTAIGVRLPIFQGPSSSFLVPLLALQRDPTWNCSNIYDVNNDNSEFQANVTMATNVSTMAGGIDPLPGIKWRLQQMGGALMAASFVEVILGGFGLLGFILRFIGPITVACTISLIGVSLYRLPIIYGRPNFIVALCCLLLVLTFVLYLNKVKLPLPKCGKGKNLKGRPRFAIFQLIPILLAVVIMWIASWILTLCNVFTDDRNSTAYKARADAKLDIIYSSNWLQLTYPGQFGAPKIHIALTIGFIVACLSSVVESVGDYYAAEKACQLGSLPDHAISRGILVEGIGSVLSGSVGAGHATTSYSGNIAVLTLSRTGSRVVMYVAAVILIVASLFGKFGAALTTIPNPILGGVLMVIVGALLTIGLSNLQHVDMSSSRNMLVVGVPFMASMSISYCLELYPEIIATGVKDLDRSLHVMLSTPMFLGGFLAMLLDNTVPGSLESRGMKHWQSQDESQRNKENDDIFTWSFYPTLVKVFPFVVSLPFMPKLISHDSENILDGDVESPTL
ncbi:solute carrier family 23 member 1 [Biomphalaria glabrata]|nr:solute carrier family 23 member 1 [Biomphalaria glabrata]